MEGGSNEQTGVLYMVTPESSGKFQMPTSAYILLT